MGVNMTILEIQQLFLDAGYQFKEQIFNDKLASLRNCSIEFSLCKNPSHFREHSSPNGTCNFRLSDVGWGRFERNYAWQQALKWLLKRKNNENSKIS